MKEVKILELKEAAEIAIIIDWFLCGVQVESLKDKNVTEIIKDRLNYIKNLNVDKVIQKIQRIHDELCYSTERKNLNFGDIQVDMFKDCVKK